MENECLIVCQPVLFFEEFFLYNLLIANWLIVTFNNFPVPLKKVTC